MRRSGILIPLFSCPSTRSWGIGDIGDLAPATAWLGAAGQRVLQLLPLNEMAAGQQSPYSATSAMAIDPIYIDMAGVPDVATIGGEDSLNESDRRSLAEARRAPRIEYASVRRLKETVLVAAFDRFYVSEWSTDSPRARSLKEFLAAEAWWIEDYALFRAIHDRAGRPWTEWPEPLKRREASALDRASRDLARDILFYQYLQWVADAQWRRARAAARANGVQLFGDLPFMVDGDSADVWLHQDEFYLDVSVGVPPDAFSATGQDWGMPVYNWNAITVKNFSWLRERARRSADLYDGYRVDHLVGFYRTYGRPRQGGEGFFNPSEQGAQQALGEAVLGVMRQPGSDILAEDLGIVPEFVRASLARLGVPGFRVLRWERFWDLHGQPFLDPQEYPASSVATSGTHDTETLAAWWDLLPADDRRILSTVPTARRIAGGDSIDRPFDPRVRDVLLELLFASGSDLLLLPVQDVFGWRDRINEPGTVKPENWTYRLPWPCDRLAEIAEARERQELLLAWARKHGRQ